MGFVTPMGVCAMRFSRTVTDGTPDLGNPQGSFIICGGVSTFAFDYDIQKGNDIYELDACGNPCVVRRYPDKVKRATFTLTLCKDDYRIAEILGVAQAVTDTGTVVGKAVSAAQGCATPVLGNGVVIELWSEQWDCDAAADSPYMRCILPLAYLTPKGYTKQAGQALPVYEGYSQSNPNLGDGPAADLTALAGLDPWVYAEIDDAGIPSCPDPLDYVATGAS